MLDKNVEFLDPRNNIYVKTGVEMSLEAEDSCVCGKCTYVGQKKDQYIVVTPPPNFPELENMLLQADRIMVRYLFEANIFEFSSKLIEIKYEPLMLLLLKFPVLIDKKELRSQKRVSCFIPAKTEVNNEIQDGIIKNISKSGCRCVFEISGTSEKKLRINDDISLAFWFPGICEPQEIAGKIKTVQRKEDSIDVGVEFTSIAWWVPPYD